MLEDGPALATWQVPLPPENWSADTITCRKLADHRLDYLTYEGPVSHGRGQVRLNARGHYQPIRIQTDHWHVHLTGRTINAQLELQLLHDDQWQLTFSQPSPQ